MGGTMNRAQQAVVAVGATAVFLMLIFPPFHVQIRDTTFNMGYGFIFDPPNNMEYMITASVDVGMLLVQWMGTLLLTGLTFFLLKSVGAPTGPKESIIPATEQPGATILDDVPGADMTYQFRDPISLTKWTKLSLYAQIGVTVVALISGYLEYETLIGLKEGSFESQQAAVSAAEPTIKDYGALLGPPPSDEVKDYGSLLGPPPSDEVKDYSALFGSPSKKPTVEDYGAMWSSPSEAEASDARQGIVGLGQLIVLVASGFLILRWIHRANWNARALGAENMQFTPGWSIGWYFVPIVNLWKPYQAMKEIWMASSKVKEWQSQTVPGLLGLWWTFWIAYSMLGNASFWMSMRAKEIDDLISANIVTILSDVAALPLCAVFLMILTRIQGMQSARGTSNNGLQRTVRFAARR